MLQARIMGAARTIIMGLLLVSCSPRSPAEPPAATHRVIIDGTTGVAFELPATWVEESLDSARIFSGPRSGLSWHTTVSLQLISPDEHGAPDELLQRAYAEARLPAPPTWLYQEATIVDSTLGHVYCVDFEHLNTPLRRLGILLPGTTGIVDITYTAPREHFAAQLDVFERVMLSMTTSQPSPQHAFPPKSVGTVEQL